MRLRDRDGKFTQQFDGIFASEDIRVQPLPIRSPNLYAYAEAWIGSLKWECLNRFTCFGQRHLDHLVREYADYYNTVRPHSSIGNAPLAPHEPIRDGLIRRESRLGGLLNHYYREAA